MTLLALCVVLELVYTIVWVLAPQPLLGFTGFTLYHCLTWPKL